MTGALWSVVADLVDDAARRLELDPDGDYGCTEEDLGALRSVNEVESLPAALEAFLRLAAGTGSTLAANWFPSALIGFPAALEGPARVRRTGDLSGADVDWSGTVPFYFDVSGTVAWVDASGGDDPPVLYLTEGGEGPRVWSDRLTDWLLLNQPGAVLP